MKQLPGFAVDSTALSPSELRRYYAACRSAARGSRDVGHFDVPAGVDVRAIASDPAVRRAVALALPGVARLVHQALHLNPPGAEPLGWHTDDCRPWFEGPPQEAPPAVRIWFFPQPVPLERGPIALVPTGAAVTEAGGWAETQPDAWVATLRAGDFLAVYDMAIVHRQMPNRSRLPRFMLRLEFTEAVEEAG